jgi:mono/diheme cytochrome c family protein
MSCLRLFVLSTLCSIPVLTLAADPPVIKKTPVAVVSPAAGPEMFKQYCAACHGMDAKGHGPAAAALKVPAPDLTLLAKNNRGKFPGKRVLAAIRGDVNVPAHGSKDMPVWGNLFREMSTSSNEAQVATRLSNLTAHIESLQQK